METQSLFWLGASSCAAVFSAVIAVASAAYAARQADAAEKQVNLAKKHVDIAKKMLDIAHTDRQPSIIAWVREEYYSADLSGGSYFAVHIANVGGGPGKLETVKITGQNQTYLKYTGLPVLLLANESRFLGSLDSTPNRDDEIHVESQFQDIVTGKQLMWEIDLPFGTKSVPRSWVNVALEGDVKAQLVEIAQALRERGKS